MFGLAILDVAIGIVFVYALAGVVTSVVWEAIESRLKRKAKLLHDAMGELLGKDSAAGITVEQLYKHPLLSALYKGAYSADGKNLPSYVPASNFALALIDLAGRGNDPAAKSPVSVDDVRLKLQSLTGNAATALKLFAAASGNDLAQLQSNIEAWYNSSMDRATGWYRRQTQFGLFLISVVLVVSMNINTIAIVEYLSTNESARTALAAQAKVYAEKSDDAKASAALETAQKLALPLGWAALAREYEVAKPASCLARVVFVLDTVLGWILTIAAVSLGAPFWFGLLNKLVALRASLKPPDAGASAAPAPPAQGGAADSARMGFGAKPAAPPNPMQGTPYQDDDTLDACCVVAGEPTPDEALPAAKGGVA